MARATLDVTRCEALAAKAAAGDEPSCRALIEHLWPNWLRIVAASKSLAQLPPSEDHAHNVVANLVEKIGRPGGKGLRLYRLWREKNADKDFGDWIRIVTANAVRDYVRAERRDAGGWVDPGPKRLLNEFASSPLLERLGIRPPITAAQTVRQLLAFAEQNLPAAQLRALSHWLDGADFDEIGERMELAGADAARKLMRAAIATLRRHFAAAG